MSKQRKQSVLDPSKFGYDYAYDNEAPRNVPQKEQSKDVKSQSSGGLKRDMKSRKITSARKDNHLKNNAISTSKYTILNFFPKNMIEQFSKMANVYFLFFGLVQMVESISISNQIPTIYLPLVIIVTITAIKDFYEDYKRKKSDQEENMSLCKVLIDGRFQEAHWRDIRVGDIVYVKNKQFFPADMLLLNSSEDKGLCYIETKGLDGETNLKQKLCQKEILRYFQNDNPQTEFQESVFNQKQIIFEYEQPNPLLNKFAGNVQIQGIENKISVDNGNFLLRGCSLRNSQYIYGLVANTGHETKIQKNSFKARAKRSQLESVMGLCIIMIFLCQVVICLFTAAWYTVYFEMNKDDQPYMEYETGESAFVTFMIKFGNWILIFGNFVPISLMVTLEFVKLFQAVLIEFDGGDLDKDELGRPDSRPNHHGMMYYYQNEQGQQERVKCVVQSSNLNEELGQVEYVFSDKTGTLTCNIMRYKKMSVGGISYGDDDVTPVSPDYIPDDEIQNFPEVTNVDFRDRKFVEALQNKSHPQHQIVLRNAVFLSLCHTILISDEEDPNDPNKTIKRYNAASPDELALVNFAKFCGVEFMGINEDENAVIKVLGEEMIVEQFEIFEFDSDRKRQSVIIRDPFTKKIKLLCKGADSIILKLSDLQNSIEVPKTNQHLDQYSLIGLRTLLLAEKEIPEDQFQKWHARYNDAKISMTDKEKLMKQCQEEIENDLIVIGATAIEDQLQDEVGDTIAALKAAEIKVWVLTGDKVETARNIGYSCKLLTPEMKQYKVTLNTDEEKNHELGYEKTISQLDALLEEINADKKQAEISGQAVKSNKALIITGAALIHGLLPEIAVKIIEITKYCEAVLCCRVSPLQKQQVVSLVRQYNPKVSTLAIGDGANDVNMITAAHVGVGIKGLEGYQAARASDYAVGEFKVLRRLLFMHGREAYRRNSRLVCYNFFKNVVLVVPQFWFSFNNFFAGQTLYESYIYQAFNVFYASMPIMIYAVMDLEFNPYILTKNTLNYYKPGIQHRLFNIKTFWQWVGLGFVHGAIIMACCFYSIQHLDFWAAGTMTFGIVVVVVNIKVFILSFDHTAISVFFNLGSMFLFFLSMLILDTFSSNDLQNLFNVTISDPLYHIANIVAIVATSFCLDFALERWIRYSDQLERRNDLEKDEPLQSSKKLGQVAPSPMNFENKEKVIPSGSREKIIPDSNRDNLNKNSQVNENQVKISHIADNMGPETPQNKSLNQSPANSRGASPLKKSKSRKRNTNKFQSNGTGQQE